MQVHTARTPRPGEAAIRTIARHVALAISTFLLAWLSIRLTRASGRVAAVWPVNAFWLAFLMRLDAGRWPTMLAAGALGNVAANLATGNTWAVSAALSSCNALEVTIAAAGLRRLVGRTVELTRARDLAVFAGLAGVVAPLTSALLASAALQVLTGERFGADLATWALADGLGLLIVTPPLLALSPEQVSRLSGAQRAPRKLFSALLACSLLAAVLWRSSGPLVFLAWPPLLYLTFEFETVGAALGLLVTAAILGGMVLTGHGPMPFWGRSETESALAIQVFLAVSVLCIWPIAARFARFRSAQASLAASRDAAKQSANDLLEAQSLTRLAGQAAGLSFWRFELESRTLTGSPGAFVTADTSPDAPPADDVWTAVHPDDKTRLLAGIRKAVKSGGEFSDQIRLLRPGRGYGQVVVRGACQRGPEGEVVSVLGTMFDVTDLKRMESAAAEIERRHRLLAEKINDIILCTTVEGRITFVSPACKTLLGYGAEDLLGMRSVHLLHPDDLAHVRKVFKAMIAERREHAPEPVPYRFRHADGHWVWLEGNPTQLFDDRGHPSGFIDVVRDVTANKLVEAELMAARVAAEEATSAKTDFLANMSHELRTPLTAIMGFSSLLGECEDLPERAALYVQRITSAGKSLLAVINDILDFSKLEAGQLELDPHPFDPTAAVEEAAALMSAQAQNKGIELRIEIAPDMPRAVAGDSARLRQILLNLLSNAVKFTREGSVTVKARHSESAEGGRLHVSVTDTGEGIPAARRDRLFQRFSQADESISRNHGGTGLGLAICKSLTALMGGSIGVESVEGEGSTFWFEIGAPPVSGMGVEAPDDGPHGGAAPLYSGNILVVDDVAVNRELVRTMLEPLGFILTEASDGAEAVQAAIQQPFDLILMDLQMPGMDGIAATRMIRASATPNRHTPIVALSANVLPAHLQACSDAGMDDHVAKPIVPAALLTKVAHWTAAQAGAEVDVVRSAARD